MMVGLGGFRGIISEVLWLRVAGLQEQGRYMEIVQLTDWINSLDPKAYDAWDYNAWNLAYNISAMIPDYNLRVEWVNAGISLLRDRAIPANPEATSLYRNLGWIYQNKIGSSDDPANVLYKINLAEETERDLTGTTVKHPLDRKTMAAVEEKFGKLDWRLPEAHAIYWAWKGLQTNPTGFEFDASRRMIQQNLVKLITNGKFVGDLKRGTWKTAPCFELLSSSMVYYEECAKDDPGIYRIYSIFLDGITKRLDELGRNDLAEITKKRLDEITPLVPRLSP